MPPIIPESSRSSPANADTSIDIPASGTSSLPTPEAADAEEVNKNFWLTTMNAVRDNKWLVVGGLGVAALGTYLYTQGRRTNLHEAQQTLERRMDEMRAKAEETMKNTKEGARLEYDKLKGDLNKSVDKVKGNVEENYEKVKGEAKNEYDRAKNSVDSELNYVKGSIQNAVHNAKDSILHAKDNLVGKVEYSKEHPSEVKSNANDKVSQLAQQREHAVPISSEKAAKELKKELERK